MINDWIQRLLEEKRQTFRQQKALRLSDEARPETQSNSSSIVEDSVRQLPQTFTASDTREKSSGTVTALED
jgi:hypothetical protein